MAKNAVEEYIYSIREKICEELEPYILEADREAYSRKLTETEDWLYEDGEECEKAVYEEKHKELKLVGEAAKKRKSELEGRKAAIDTLGHSLQMAVKVVEAYKAGDEKYNHLTDAEVEKVNKLIEEKPEIVQAFVTASIEGWRSYLMDDPTPGNQLILSSNQDMTQDILDQAINQIRDRGLVISGDALDKGIGTMTRQRWKSFFTLMAENGLYDMEMNWENAFTTKFVNKAHSK